MDKIYPVPTEVFSQKLKKKQSPPTSAKATDQGNMQLRIQLQAPDTTSTTKSATTRERSRHHQSRGIARATSGIERIGNRSGVSGAHLERIRALAPPRGHSAKP